MISLLVERGMSDHDCTAAGSNLSFSMDYSSPMELNDDGAWLEPAKAHL